MELGLPEKLLLGAKGQGALPRPEGHGDSHGSRSRVLPGQSTGNTSGAEDTLNIEITNSEVSSQLSSMDKNIKIKSRVIICSIHYILEVLTGTAELGPTSYKGQSWI